MAEFRTLYEQKKWNDISAMDKQSLRRLSKGEGTEGDIEAVQGLIAQYQNLVSSTFRSGLRTLKTVAELRVQKVAEHREALGKSELSEEQYSKLVSLAESKQWEIQGPELASLLETELAKSTGSQTKDIESMLDEKLQAYRPQKKEDKSELERFVENTDHGREESTSALDKAMENQREDITDIPLSEQIIEQANDSYRLTDDLKDELDDLTNESKKDKRESSKISKWWRAFKDKTSSVKGKSKSLAMGLALLVGKLIATELTGGKLWEKMQEYFTWDNITNLSKQLYEFGAGLMEKGWAVLSDYMSFEKVKVLFKQAVQYGLQGLGAMGNAIKSFFGFEEDTPPVTVPGPGDAAKAKVDQDQTGQPTPPGGIQPQFGPEVPVQPTSQSASAPPQYGSEVPTQPTSQAVVPGPGSESKDETTVAQTAPKVDDPNPAQDSTLIDTALGAKGAGTALPTKTEISSPTVDLGKNHENEIPKPKVEPEKKQGQQSGNKPSGGVQATMEGFARGLSVDGTLTVMNFGMLTN